MKTVIKSLAIVLIALAVMVVARQAISSPESTALSQPPETASSEARKVFRFVKGDRAPRTFYLTWPVQFGTVRFALFTI